MKYLGTITDNKDITTKEYVDNAIAASGGGGGLTPTQIVDLIYPVGSTYISFNSTNPNTLFGGTWEQIKDKFLLAAGDTYAAGTTGGSADAVTVSHTHTQEKHTHMLSYSLVPRGTASSKVRNFYGDGTTGDTSLSPPYATPTINSTGVSGTGKNMPPYLTVYMWKRTA